MAERRQVTSTQCPVAEEQRARATLREVRVPAWGHHGENVDRVKAWTVKADQVKAWYRPGLGCREEVGPLLGQRGFLGKGRGRTPQSHSHVLRLSVPCAPASGVCSLMPSVRLPGVGGGRISAPPPAGARRD